MSLPKWWTECHEEVTRNGEAQPCDKRPVVALRADLSDGGTAEQPRTWYPVCAKHVRSPMVDFWQAVDWSIGNPS